MALDAVQPPKRTHVADHVFDELARAILEGELAPGSAMPPERVLVERFGVSRVLARQALHRLAEIGLVRVRQGGATIVLDPNEVSDLRVLALFYRLAGGFGAIEIADIIEKQYLQGLSLVEVASRRASTAALDEVGTVLDDAAKDATTAASFAKLEERFWRALAGAAQNRIFKMEIAWWYETLTDRPVPDIVAGASITVRLAFYRELLRRLREKDDPVSYYLAATRPILDAVMGAK